MAITVTEFFTRVAHDLHEEDTAFSSLLWTPAEMIEYLNHAQRDFYRRTGIYKTDATVPLAPGGTIVFDKPNGIMDMERISLNYKRVRRVTSWDLQRENPLWRANPNGSPHYYHEDHLPIGQFEFDKVPAQGGSYRIFADILPTENTDMTGNIQVDDVWEQYIRWEVMSLALGRDGENQDVARSRYAHQRYLLGVALAKRLVFGTSIAQFPQE